MSRICQMCGKTSIMATVRKKLRGKYNPTTKRRKYPNLQWKVLNGIRVKICMKCFRTTRKVKQVKVKKVPIPTQVKSISKK